MKSVDLRQPVEGGGGGVHLVCLFSSVFLRYPTSDIVRMAAREGTAQDL